MRSCHVALFLCCVSLPCLAQAKTGVERDPGAATPTAVKHGVVQSTGNLAGTVLCDDTHGPARNAEVIAYRVPGATENLSRMEVTHVRVDGRYSFERLPEGDYAVFAIFPGYLSDLDEVVASSGDSDDRFMTKEVMAHGTVLVRNGTTANADLVLHRGAAFSGRVLYADGTPAVGATVTAEDADARSGIGNGSESLGAKERSIVAQREHSLTDDQGGFRLAGLPPGRYHLLCRQAFTDVSIVNASVKDIASNYPPSVPGPDVSTLYAGNTRHRQDARIFEVTAGEERRGVDFTMPTAAFHEVRGSVQASDGRPINMATITLRDAADQQISFATSTLGDSDFGFKSILPGTYTLTVSNARIAVAAIPPTNKLASYRPWLPKAAFAESNMRIVVKDSDLDGLAVVLEEAPLPEDLVTTE